VWSVMVLGKCIRCGKRWGMHLCKTCGQQYCRRCCDYHGCEDENGLNWNTERVEITCEICGYEHCDKSPCNLCLALGRHHE